MRSGFRWAMAAGAAMAVVLAAVGVAWAAGGGTRTIHVIEHAKTDTVIDVGTHGDSTGDLLTFHNRVFDRHDRHSVGRDQGHCIRISPHAGTWECYWTTFLRHGSLEVAGPFSDRHDTDLAITGGTGDYRRARGEMHLHARHGGTEYDFVFHVSS
jgi:allene oxide cyclase